MRPVQHNYYHKDSVIERERLVPITVPASSTETHLSAAQLDSLRLALQSMPQVHRTVYLTDPKLQTRLSFALDSIGNLVVRCETLEKMYWEKLKEKDRIINIKELEIRKQQKSFIQKVEGFIHNGIWWAIISAIVFFTWEVVKLTKFKRA